MAKCGFQDTPIKKENEERLGLGEYAGALAEFIERCDTPMTISIQGDWGSGKTSMIHLIMNQLPKAAIPVYINTWQFAQFDRHNDIAISVLTEFVDALGGSSEDGKILKTILSNFSRHAGKIAAAADFLGVPLAKVIEGAGKAAESLTQESTDTQKIKELRNRIQDLVAVKNKEKSADRFVAFIDDLDRLTPEKAVEVLEAIKLFLDLPGCVFVLAIDYEVVVKGVSQKYGSSMDAQKGKDFFDKMIQLPFNMPVGQYAVQQYMKNLLEGIDSQIPEDELQIYQELAQASIGFNPRGMKRMFNTLLLLRLVAKRKKQETDDVVWQRILFALLCLQSSFEPIYRYLASCKKIDEMHVKQFISLAAESEVHHDAHEVVSQLKNIGPTTIIRASRFMQVFFNALQLEAEGDYQSLSQKELALLKSVISLAALSTTETRKEMDWGKRKANREFIKRFNKRISEENEKVMHLFKGIQVYQRNTEEYANSQLVFSVENGTTVKLELEWDMNDSVIFLWVDQKSARDKVNKWLSDITGLKEIEKYFMGSGDQGVLGWGRFSFEGKSEKAAEDEIVRIYERILNLLSEKLVKEQNR